MHPYQMITVPRGSIYWLNNNFNSYMKGSVQGKSRPVVVVSSNNRGNSSIVEVCTITHVERSDKCSRINVKFINDKGENNWIQSNQHFTVNISDLGKFIGILPPEVLRKFDEGLLVSQGFDHLIDCDKEIQNLRAKVAQLEAERLDYSYVEVLRYELTELCREFNYLVSDGNRKINDILRVKSEIVNATDSESVVKKPDKKANKPAPIVRKYVKWTEDNMLEFLCDTESGMSDEDIMRKWDIPNKAGIKKKVAYIKKKLGM